MVSVIALLSHHFDGGAIESSLISATGQQKSDFEARLGAWLGHVFLE